MKSSPMPIKQTLEYLQRIGQIIGKYSLEQPYYFGWGHIALLVSPRGFITRQYPHDRGAFWFELDIYRDELKLCNSHGRATLKLVDKDTIANFYHRFIKKANELNIPPPISAHETELQDALPFAEDTAVRTYDAQHAQSIIKMYSMAAGYLEGWQANYVGYTSSVGVMWGGFDLATARYNKRSLPPKINKPVYYQNAELSENIMVGFWLGKNSETPEFFAYIMPQPKQIDTVDFASIGAEWSSSEGLAILPWETVQKAQNPYQTVIKFGDLIYETAIKLSDWPDNNTIPRVTGIEASKQLVQLANHKM